MLPAAEFPTTRLSAHQPLSLQLHTRTQVPGQPEEGLLPREQALPPASLLPPALPLRRFPGQSARGPVRLPWGLPLHAPAARPWWHAAPGDMQHLPADAAPEQQPSSVGRLQAGQSLLRSSPSHFISCSRSCLPPPAARVHNPDSLELASPLLLHPCFPSETAFFSSLIPLNFQLHIQKTAASLSSPTQLSLLLICSDVPPAANPVFVHKTPGSGPPPPAGLLLSAALSPPSLSPSGSPLPSAGPLLWASSR